MSSSLRFASGQQPEKAALHNYALLAGGYFSLAFAILQATGIWWSPSAIKYLGGPAELSIQKPMIYAALCVIVAAGVAVVGLYALSGAGKIRRLPLLRTGLIIVTGIYLLRGLLAIPQLPVVLAHPNLVRFLVFSVISLGVGAVYLIGVMSLYRHGRPGEMAPDSRVP
jgi:hypothetical protein